MRVNGKKGITKRARVFGKSDGERDEENRSPKIRNFEPNQRREECRARQGEEATEDGLLLIVTEGGEFRREIEHRPENRQRDEACRDVLLRWGVDVQIEGEHPIEIEG